MCGTKQKISLTKSEINIIQAGGSIQILLAFIRDIFTYYNEKEVYKNVIIYNFTINSHNIGSCSCTCSIGCRCGCNIDIWRRDSLYCVNRIYIVQTYQKKDVRRVHYGLFFLFSRKIRTPL